MKMRKKILSLVNLGLVIGGGSIVALNISSCASTYTYESYNTGTPYDAIAVAKCSYKEQINDGQWKVGVKYDFVFSGYNNYSGEQVHLGTGGEVSYFQFSTVINGAPVNDPNDYFTFSVSSNRLSFTLKQEINPSSSSYISWNAYCSPTGTEEIIQSYIDYGSIQKELPWMMLPLGGQTPMSS